MIAAAAPISIASSIFVVLVAATEIHISDRHAQRRVRPAQRSPYVRGVLLGGSLLAILATIFHLIIMLASTSSVDFAGAIIILLLGALLAFEFGKARNVAGEDDPYRDLVIEYGSHSAAPEVLGVRLALSQGSRIAAAWLGVSLFSNAFLAAAAIGIGALAALILHRRVIFRAAPSVLYAGCAAAAVGLGLHVLVGSTQGTGAFG